MITFRIGSQFHDSSAGAGHRSPCPTFQNASDAAGMAQFLPAGLAFQAFIFQLPGCLRCRDGKRAETG